MELGIDINSMDPGTGLDRAPLHNAAGLGCGSRWSSSCSSWAADPHLRDLKLSARTADSLGTPQPAARGH